MVRLSSGPLAAAFIGLALASLGGPAAAVKETTRDRPPPAVDPKSTTREMITADPAAPVAGNPAGDVTIVAYLDYNCGYCKASAPALEKLVRTDGKVRLVYKDWPILAASSVYGAKLALAARYQGKYDAAHAALMGLKGAGVANERMLAAVAAAGVDTARLTADAAAHDADIVALIRRNDAQARGMMFPGTPVYLIGPLLVAAPLDYAGFRDAVAKARARQGT